MKEINAAADQDLTPVGLGYRFSNPQYILEAMTHRSFRNERRHDTKVDNERLEFLGDSVLSCVIATELWHLYPKASEGELTRRRADAVCEASLAAIAGEIGIGEKLRLGKGEELSGGRSKPRLLACGLEACLGAVYLDGGMEALKAVIQTLFNDTLRQGTPGERDFKSRLQEYAQAELNVTPTYTVTEDEQSPAHARCFHARVCFATSGVIAEGQGGSKNDAEQNAAKAALAHLLNPTPQ